MKTRTKTETMLSPKLKTNLIGAMNLCVSSMNTKLKKAVNLCVSSMNMQVEKNSELTHR